MTYVLPQVKVFQDFQAVPDIITDPLRAFITGPNYAIKRYNNSSEKADIALGTYAEGGLETTAIPGFRPGGVLDTSYTKVYIDNAWIEVLNAATPNLTDATSNTLTFAYNVTSDYGGTLYAGLNGRSLKIGDKVRVTTTANTNQVLDTFIAGFVPTTSSAAIAAPTAHAANKEADLGDSTVGVSTADANNTTAAVNLSVSVIDFGDFIDLTGTDDLPIEFTYTFTVTETFDNGNRATLRVSNGIDTTTDYNADFGSSGTTVTVTDGDTSVLRSLSVTFERGSSSIKWAVGDKYYVRGNASSDYTVPTPSSTGTYTGLVDTVYIIQCVQGGATPKVFVSTNNGSDVNRLVSLTDNAYATITTKGVQFKLNWGTGLAKGDIWYVSCTAAAPTGVSTIRLGSNLLNGQDETTVTVQVCTTTNILVDSTYFSQDATNATITIDNVYTAYNGNPFAPVIKGDVYVEHRELVNTFADRVYDIDDISEVESTLGPVTPDNPLAQGVYLALLNANGTTVKYMAVATDDAPGYSEVLEKLKERDDVYSLVPLTQSRAIQNTFAGHVDAMSTAESGRWRITFVNSEAPDWVNLTGTLTLTDTTNTSEVVVSSNDSILTDTSATFITDGVAAGDTVRFYNPSGYSTATILAVQNEHTLTLENDLFVDFSGDYAVYHEQTRNQIADAYAAISGSFADKRVFHVWPDVITSAGVALPGYFLCAAIAGLVSGVVPQQGLTNVEIAGFDNVDRTTKLLNRPQLDTLAAAGTFVVTQSPTGTVYTRHELSTDMTDINTKELMITKNVDSISYSFLSSLTPLIGRSNVTPSAIELIHTQLAANISFLKSAGFVNNVGPQLIDATISKLEANPVLKDKVDAVINLTIPYPLNVLETHLVI